MKVSTNILAELVSYLTDLKSLIPTLPLDQKIFKEGTTISQLTFHTSQSVQYYFRSFILEEDYKRNRSEEYTTTHSQEELITSIDKALETCKAVIQKQINLEDTLKKTKMVHSRNFEITTVFETIQHVTAHTAEHFGQIKIAINHL